jgi:CSLREA domain-containing protein
MKKSRCRYRISFAGFILALLLAASVEAATLTVNSTADDGTGTCTASKCTLRDAILNAGNFDTITFSLPANSAINLTNGELPINSGLTINGPGANLLTVQRSTASGTPQFRIFNIASNASATISGLTISNGSAAAVGSSGGGIFNRGTLTITNSIISGNSADTGGGICNSSGNLSLAIINSTISGNSAGNGGGGICHFGGGPVTITNSTIFGNSGLYGGGIYKQGSGPVTITSSTISGNTGSNSSGGGGIFNQTGTVTAKNTIIALNTAPIGPDVSGSFTSQGFNLIGKTDGSTGFTAATDQTGTVAVPLDPLLDSLQDNGGPTKTQALLSGSKAIDKGDSSGSSTDQRGFTRPIDTPVIANATGGDGSDIGAYEVQPDQLAGCSEINLVVKNNSDADAASLRDVIANACGGSTITFAANVRGAINLTSNELLINKAMTISGPGANLLSVQRSASAGNFRIFNIASASVNAAISGLTIANGVISSGGGINNPGTLTLTSVTISGNTATNGGGIFNSGTVTLTNSTMSGNTVNSIVAGSGGGIFNNGGTVNLTNSTISGNTANGPSSTSDSGGGIFTNIGTVNLTDSTISGNSGDLGGGLRNVNKGSVVLGNTIIALNNSPSGPDVNGPLTSQGFNLIGNASGATITPTTGDQVGVTATQLNLGPLQDNGGPTQTHALLSGSFAIDQGLSFRSTTDQRGFARPIDLPNVPNGDGDAGDIGAFEVQAPTPIPTPTPTPTPTATPTTLANISTRLRVETGDNVLIGGFIVTGTQSKKVMIRAIGPSLPFADDLADPILELHDSSGALLDSNDNWVDSPNKQAIIDSTIAPTNDLESAIVATLPANGSGYTAIVRGVNNGTGIGVVEAYDLDRTVDSKLANISTRGLVQTGDDVLIAGTIVVGQAPQKVIVEALGPSLSVPGKLEDPILELRDGNGGLVDSNDNWVDSPNKQAIIDSTIPPSNDFESAIIAALPAGGAQYTAIVRGVNNATGIAVVEVFALQ